MIELISGSSGYGKGAYMIDRIREKLDSGKKLYLIVPEQQAVIWEERVCRELPPSAALSLEVLSFRRLANTVAREVGGLAFNYTGERKKMLLMWSAITAVNENLSVYRSSDGREDKYIKLMLDTVGELRMNRVFPAALDAAAKALSADENDTLSDRLRDLSLIWAAYKALQDNDETEDPDTLLETLEETLRTNDFFGGAEVFIDSFFSLTPIETEILYHMIRQADSVYVTFTFDPERPYMHFDHIRKFYRQVLRLSDRAGKEIRQITLGENRRAKKDSLLYLEKNLWNFAAPTADTEDKNSVKIITCADRYEEARAIGAVIEKLVHEGAAYSDIAVVARDIETLSGILDTRLEKLGIPFHLARRRDIVSTPAVKLVTGLLDVIHSGFKRDKIIACIKTGLCPVSPIEGANFEQYTDTWNIRGKKAYLDGEVWSMNPAGYVRALSPWGQSVLIDANKVKSVMAEPLARLWDLFDSSADVREVSAALYEILCSFGVYESLTAEAVELRLEGKNEEADAAEKLFGIILDALDTMVETIGDARLDAGRFSRLFAAVASSFDVGTIPAGVDVVTLGSAHSVRCGEIKHVIMPGCIEGEFPASVREKGFFSDSDKLALESVDIILSENTTEALGEELFRFWRTMTMASETVTLIVPAASGGAYASPSVGAAEVKRLLGITEISFAELSERDLVWSENSAASEAPFLSERPSQRGAFQRVFEEIPEINSRVYVGKTLSAENESVSKATAEKLFGDRMALTQSRIDRFTKCRFSYYMNYIMKLKEEKRATVGALDVGNLIHRILELFFSEVRGREMPLERKETEEIADRIIAEYIDEIMCGAPLSSRQDYLFSRLRRNVLVLLSSLMEEFAGSSFLPFRFELSMSGKTPDSPTPLTFLAADGTKVSVYGTIDRVDTFAEDGKVYVRVVDYKTGTKKFSEKDIKRGLDLQLLIYLFTLWKGPDCEFKRTLAPSGEEIVPAAILYLGALSEGGVSDTYLIDGSGETQAKKNLARSGLYLNDEKALSAMDRELTGKYIPLDKKGKPDAKALKTLEEFGQIFADTEETILRIAGEMKSGKCQSLPLTEGMHSPCSYCKFKPVCRHIEGKEGESTDD